MEHQWSIAAASRRKRWQVSGAENGAEKPNSLRSAALRATIAGLPLTLFAPFEPIPVQTREGKQICPAAAKVGEREIAAARRGRIITVERTVCDRRAARPFEAQPYELAVGRQSSQALSELVSLGVAEVGESRRGRDTHRRVATLSLQHPGKRVERVAGDEPRRRPARELDRTVDERRGGRPIRPHAGTDPARIVGIRDVEHMLVDPDTMYDSSGRMVWQRRADATGMAGELHRRVLGPNRSERWVAVTEAIEQELETGPGADVDECDRGVKALGGNRQRRQ